MTPSGLAEALRVLLSNVVALSFRVQGHHWNVEGVDFHQFHDFFQDIYDDVSGSIDPIAENIRKLGEYSPFRLERLIELKTLPDSGRTPTDGLSLCRDLVEVNDFIVNELKSVFDLANSANEQGIANFIADRIDMHQKWAWQLKSVTK